ncbi:MAG: hypothetical protein QF842_01355 [Candidatus Marinimicrobia bacterium]|jgi:hypothetical protein|nr:hypothetical protein [Candidatus Neomarinimicrobiota bacterium]MDP6611978.1 hypothetical protein [Candidatus Neomarinimicrobiota bacterium]|tara:strand:+ start:669 stop:1925 length:1257 start_codon:yes stop_codon:yes gene_type:complete
MFYLRKIILLLFVTGLSAQSIFNAYGLGLSKSIYNTSSAGAGSIGLVPTFHPGVSLDNPATWPGLKYTFISGSYGSRSVGTNKNNSKNNGNGFEKIQFVIPIRERFGFGVSIKPVNNHNSFFRTDTSTIDFQGKPITANKEFRSGGGIMAGSVGLALPLNKKMGLGLSIDRLFGSSRDEHSMVLNSISYRLFNIRTYNGSTFNLDFAGQFFKNDKMMVLGFARISVSGKPVSGTLYQFDLFEDKNDNYVFDSGDFPSTVSVDTNKVSDIYAPNSFSFGLNVGFKNDLNVFGEFQMWNDEALNADYASIYMDQIGSKTHIGGGLVRFGNMGARSWQDKITFRAGAFRESYSLKYSGKTINENGLSIGFGFKFAATGNQLDFSYRTGSRSIDGGYKELMQDFTIGVSLGDVWFLRRRGKQ